MTVQDVITALAPKAYDIASVDTVTGARIDSRKVASGDLFFCIKGEQTDGNLYAQSALYAGASLVVMDNEAQYNRITGNKVLVQDSVEALKAVGTYRLSRAKGKKIAITGSMGKTSTKEMVQLVLGQSLTVYANPGNYNNDLGVAVTAAGLDEHADVLVFELGSNNSGEIAELSRYVQPDIAIVTGIGHAHVGRFGGYDAIGAEKISIADGLVDGGLLIAHESARPFAHLIKDSVAVTFFGTGRNNDVRMIAAVRNGLGFQFDVAEGNSASAYRLNHIYRHFAENALAAIVAARHLGLDQMAIVEGVAAFTVPAGRGKLVQNGGLVVVDDCYNMSLEAALSAIDNIADSGIRPAYALIGEMAEIEGFEKQLTEALAVKAAECPQVRFLFCGALYAGMTQTDNVTVVAEKEAVKPHLDAITEGIILVKAANSRKFSEFVSYLTERNGAENAV